ncbi:MAG: class I SAM-dependent methyltransferase [Lentisphaerae bacterium]|jgi:ubiquinone/menaquinone biosynthesis C-methylase UbiE|nr:class I SAM-dependent methyltransferase [Lentisphaerota bacterium]
MSAEFDQYVSTYDQAWARANRFMGKSHDFYTLAKAKHILSVLRRHKGEPRQLSLLDVGCGVGKTDYFLQDEVKELAGVDISAASIERARQENPAVRYEVYDGRHLPFGDEAFDVAILICVLHHVAVAERAALLREVRRVLKPGGFLLVIEHNPFNPLTRLSVARCEFDRDARLLRRGVSVRLLREAELDVVESRYFLVFPFAFKGSDRLERAVGRLPLGAQYYAAGRKR